MRIAESRADIAAELYVLTDPLALDVVVRNMLENALAALAGGGGRVQLTARADERRGRARGARQRGRLRPADGARLFEKFTRLHPGGGSSYYGTGLGLFIVRRLMQLARGTGQRAQRRSRAGRALRARLAAARR